MLVYVACLLFSLLDLPEYYNNTMEFALPSGALIHGPSLAIAVPNIRACWCPLVPGKSSQMSSAISL